MSRTIQLLTTMDVIAIHGEALAQSGDRPSQLVRQGGLESAIAHLSAMMWYENAGLSELAVGLLMKIALAHAWVDGNKRTALRAKLFFLELNGVRVDDDDLMKFAVQFVSTVGQLPEDRESGIVHLQHMVESWIATES